jgi:hypothetical protein
VTGVTSATGMTTPARPGPSGDATRSHSLAGMIGTVGRSVAARPWLAPEALAEGLRLARPGWWHRRPFLPVPDPALWRFRMETAYGGAGDATPPPEDIRAFLRWCAGMRRWRKSAGPAR